MVKENSIPLEDLKKLCDKYGITRNGTDHL